MREIVANLIRSPCLPVALPGDVRFPSVRIGREMVVYIGLIVAAVGIRFWDLAGRSLNHDESIHAFVSWQLFQGQGYEHFPLAHGPLQFFGTAFSFFLFGGAGDYTLRILPALAGSSLVLLPWLLRSRLGSAGTLFCTAAIAFSPTLLFFSRFARNDIYIALFTMAIIVALWRYLNGGKHRYLWAAAFFLGLSFATKENIYINVAIVVAFLNFWLAFHFWRQIQTVLKENRIVSFISLLVLLPFTWVVVALWPFTKNLRMRIGLTEWHRAADFLILLGTLSIPQFSAGVRVPLDGIFGIDAANLNTPIWLDTNIGPFDLGTTSRENLLGLGMVIGLTAASAVVGLRWNAKTWLLIAFAFYVPYVLLYTSFLTNIDGFYSGNWGALDYWLDQQEVRRGNQPWFYYLMFLPAYEFLPLAIAAPALFYYAIKGDAFRRFLVFWVMATLAGYSMASEKMPWISVHTTLPLIVLASFALGRLYEHHVPNKMGFVALSPGVLSFLGGSISLAATAVGIFGPESSSGIAFRVAVVAVAMCMIIVLVAPVNLKRTVVVVSSTIVGILFAFTLFVGIRAAFQLGDVPRELYVYAQGSSDVPEFVARVDSAARASDMGKDLPIVVDGGLEPWAWYFREYDHLSYTNVVKNFEPPVDAVLIVYKENEMLMEPYLAQYADPQDLTVIWWFPEFDTYKTLPSAEKEVWSASPGFLSAVFVEFVPHFTESIFRGETWARWWSYFRDRDPGVPLNLRREMVTYIPKDYAMEVTIVGQSHMEP